MGGFEESSRVRAEGGKTAALSIGGWMVLPSCGELSWDTAAAAVL